MLADDTNEMHIITIIIIIIVKCQSVTLEKCHVNNMNIFSRIYEYSKTS